MTEPARRRTRRRATGGTSPPTVAPAPAAPGSAHAPPPAAPPTVDGQPVLPTRSADDTDQGWGERPAGGDDERFLREVPPHW